MEAMERLMAGRTSFMIAHRLGTLDVCDLQFAIDEGRIATRARRPAKPQRPAPDDVSDHPAVKAWLSLGGAEPREIGVLKASRYRKLGAYRLEGAGPGHTPVIAKVCKRKTAEAESSVYEELLPRLPMPHLRYFGKVRDPDREHWWLFIEDAGAEGYSPAEPEHRRLAARWLAAVQLHAAEFLGGTDLPDRGPRHYLVHLLNAREEIVRQLRLHDARSDEAPVLEDLLSKLDVLEARWGELAAFCDTLPRTLVHGDFVSRNLRIIAQGRQHRARDLRLGDRGPRGSGSRPGAAARAPARRAGPAEAIEATSIGSPRIPPSRSTAPSWPLPE